MYVFPMPTANFVLTLAKWAMVSLCTHSYAHSLAELVSMSPRTLSIISNKGS